MAAGTSPITNAGDLEIDRSAERLGHCSRELDGDPSDLERNDHRIWKKIIRHTGIAVGPGRRISASMAGVGHQRPSEAFHGVGCVRSPLARRTARLLTISG